MLAGSEQDPQRLAGLAGARLGRVGHREGLTCGADRVQGIGFAGAAVAAPGPVGLKDMLASSSQGTGQPGAV